MIDLALGLRPFDPVGERSWVIDSWKRSACDSWDALNYSSFDDYKADVAPVVTDLIERVPVHVAHLAEDSDAAIAWACLEADQLHYVFVKRRWRKLGVAGWLLGQLGVLNRPIEYTFRTRMCESKRLRGARIEPVVKVPKDWQYRKFKAWRKAS